MVTAQITVEFEGGDQVTDVFGALQWTPSARHLDLAAVVLPTPFRTTLTVSPQVITVPLSEPTWCWKVRELVPGGVLRYVTVTGDSAYSALQDVDPESLQPSAVPPAAWTVGLAALQAGVDQATAAATLATSTAVSATTAADNATAAAGVATTATTAAAGQLAAATAGNDALIAADVNAAVPPAVTAAVAAAPTVTAAAADAASAAVTANIAGRSLVEGGAIRADLQPTPPLGFVVVDQGGVRTEVELGVDGKFTQRVVDSLSARIGAVPSAELLAGRGSQASLTGRLDHALTAYGTLRGYSAFEWNLRWTRMLTRRILYGDTASQLSVALIGDSYTFNTARWSRPFYTAMKALYGDGGIGWVGFSNDLSTQGVNGSVRSDVTVVETGAWVDTYAGTHSPDLGEETSSTAGNTIVVTFPAGISTAAKLMYIGTADGNITYQFNGGGASTPLSLVAAVGTLQIAALAGVTATSTTLTITVVSGSVRLCGVTITGTHNGVIVHKLGSTGSRANQWAAVNADWKTGLAALTPNLVIVMLGVNDQGSDTATTFAASMQAIIANVQAAVGSTAVDILIAMPAENQRGLPITMASYAAAMLPIADTAQAAYIDLQSLFGVSPADYAYGSARPWYASDNVHPDPATGGRVMADAILRVVNDK